MKPEWRRFAPWGLFLAGAAALASLSLAIVLQAWTLPVQISVGLIVLGLASFVYLDPDRARRALTGRQARYGSNAVVLLIAFVGILTVINYIVYKNTQNWTLRWDLTEDQTFSLTSETLQVLETMPETVKALAFFTAQTPIAAAQDILETFKVHSKGKFEYEFIDPDDPQFLILAQQANVLRDGTIVLQMGELQEQVPFASEQEMTGALIRLLNPAELAIYFLTGHGERGLDDPGDEGLSQVKQALEGKNYTVNTLNLLATNQLPEDAKVIVIAGPMQPVSEQETAMLSDYVAAGGALIVMEEPTILTEFGDSPDPLKDYLSATWGIELGADIVLDLTAEDPFTAGANQYATHKITDEIQNTFTFFPTARSVTVSASGNAQELILTAEQSWAEKDLEALLLEQQLEPNEDVDDFGPISLAVVAEDFTTEARVIVVGDSDFAANINLPYYGNSDLLTGFVDWAAEQEDLINLTPKDTTQRFILPPTQATLGLIFLGVIVVIPGTMLGIGIVVWLQRRKKG